eukprot:1867044-Amphidinium_carterae.1
MELETKLQALQRLNHAEMATQVSDYSHYTGYAQNCKKRGVVRALLGRPMRWQHMVEYKPTK